MDEITIAIIAVGVALAGLMLVTTRAIRSEIADVRKSLGSEIADMRKGLGGEIADVRKDLGGQIADARMGLGSEAADLRRGQEQLRERMARLEGLLEGLREAITRNRAA